MSLGIGIGISWVFPLSYSSTALTLSGSATLTQNLEITFTLTTSTVTYAGVEWGVDPTYSYTVFDPTPSLSRTLVIDQTDSIVQLTTYIWRPYTNIDPLDSPATRVYGTGGTVTTGANPVAPGAPTSLTLGTPTGSTQPLTWTAPVSNGGATITDYVVEYSTDNITFNTFTDGVSSATSATVTGLLNGTLYYYRVKAVNSAGTGSASTVASGSTASAWANVTSSTMGFAAGPLSSRDTGTFSVSVGQLIIVMASWENNDGTTRTVTDTAGNTYTALTLRADSPRQWSQLFYSVATSASASNTVTLTFGVGTIGYCSVVASVFNHPSGTVTVDSEGGGAVATTQNTSTSIDPVFSGAGLVVYGAKGYSSGTYSSGSGWTSIGTNSFYTAEYQIVSNGNAITGVVNRSTGTTQYVDAWAAFYMV